MQVMTIWKSVGRHFGVYTKTVKIVQGFDPVLRDLLQAFLLNASTAAAAGGQCSEDWFRIKVKAEGTKNNKHEDIFSLKQEHASTPLRHFTELRIFIEDGGLAEVVSIIYFICCHFLLIIK